MAKAKSILVGAVDKFPDEILAGIGRVVAKWGYLQFQLGVIIREIASLPKDTGRVLMVGAELKVMCNMLRTFTSSDRWIADPVLREEIKQLGKAVQDAAGERNDYAHGVYGLRATSGEPIRYLLQSKEHRREPGEEVITAALLSSASDRAQRLWERAENVTQRLKASPKRRR